MSICTCICCTACVYVCTQCHARCLQRAITETAAFLSFLPSPCLPPFAPPFPHPPPPSLSTAVQRHREALLPRRQEGQHRVLRDRRQGQPHVPRGQACGGADARVDHSVCESVQSNAVQGPGHGEHHPQGQRQARRTQLRHPGPLQGADRKPHSHPGGRHLSWRRWVIVSVSVCTGRQRGQVNAAALGVALRPAAAEGGERVGRDAHEAAGEDGGHGEAHPGEARDLRRPQQGRMPRKIIYFRDGVADSQFESVITTELMDMRRGINSLRRKDKDNKYIWPKDEGAEKDIRITAVIHQKRHHVRLFPTNQRDVDSTRSQNCQPGTVVDQKVVHPYGFDFFLLSHAGIQGTSRPSYYRVILDENGYGPDWLQQVTFYLCHLYAACPRSISGVPQCFYANRLAMRVRDYLYETKSDTASHSHHSGGEEHSMQRLHPALKNKMFFA